MALRDQPLFLPPGSVRALLAFLFSCGFLYSCVTHNGEAAAALGPIAALIVKDYFTARHGSAKPKPKGIDK
jgi:hypothetical protein